MYYPKGGNTRPPVILPVGNLLLNPSVKSRPARFNSGGNLFSMPQNSPPNPGAGFTSGNVLNDLPTVKLLIWSIPKFLQFL